MFLFTFEIGTKPTQKGNNGTERLARVREPEHCSVPVPVPFRPSDVPMLSGSHA